MRRNGVVADVSVEFDVIGSVNRKVLVRIDGDQDGADVRLYEKLDCSRKKRKMSACYRMKSDISWLSIYIYYFAVRPAIKRNRRERDNETEERERERETYVNQVLLEALLQIVVERILRRKVLQQNEILHADAVPGAQFPLHHNWFPTATQRMSDEVQVLIDV